MQSAVPGPLVVRPKDVQKLLSIGKTKVDQLIADGTLESYKLAPRIRVITMKSVTRLLEADDQSLT
jgi:hypothetical protein